MDYSEEFLKELSGYQQTQSRHDNDYHSDIVDPGKDYQLNHIALHFAKYSYKLMNENAVTEYDKAFIDTFIMAMSASVVLKIDFEKNTLDINSDKDSFFNVFIKNMSLFAKACEAVGHLKENFPTHNKQVESVLHLINACLIQSKKRNIDILHSAIQRLSEVEKIIDKQRYKL